MIKIAFQIYGVANGFVILMLFLLMGPSANPIPEYLGIVIPIVIIASLPSLAGLMLMFWLIRLVGLKGSNCWLVIIPSAMLLSLLPTVIAERLIDEITVYQLSLPLGFISTAIAIALFARPIQNLYQSTDHETAKESETH